MNRCVDWAGCILVAAAVVGCRWANPAPAGTGAEAVVRGYYEALSQQDWPRAYAALHADSRAGCGGEMFARLAQGYRQGLGFEPQGVHVRSCEEHGSEAVAHVVLTGMAGGRRRTFRDAVTLRRDGTGWGVVLPVRFGQHR